MREIKFRAWNMVTKTMIDLKKVTPLALNMDTDGLFIPASGMPVMQYVGLEDKNNKQIYEGDIIHVVYKGGPIKTFTGQVEFENCEYILTRKHDWMPLNQHSTIEIIGNIHQNPELLTQGK